MIDVNLYHGTSWFQWLRNENFMGLHVTSNIDSAISYSSHSLESSYNDEIEDEDMIVLMESIMLVVIKPEVFNASTRWEYEPDDVCDGNTWKETFKNCNMFVISNFSNDDKKNVSIIIDSKAKRPLMRLFGRIPKNVSFKDFY